jgi:thioredoxin reductase (NADPH)
MTDQVIDAVVIGAGPCGLFQVFQLGLQGIRCHVVEAAGQPGGQCHELYADKPIYDIPGIPHILAGDLSAQLLKQIEPFDPTFSFYTTVTGISQAADNHYVLQTDNDLKITCRHVVVATGAGAFTPVKMRVEGIEIFEERQLFYRSLPAPAPGAHITVVGDTQMAVDAALSHTKHGNRVTYIHRKKRMVASPESLEALDGHHKAGSLSVVQGRITEVKTEGGNISHLIVNGSDRQTRELPTDTIVALLGNSPKMHNYADWGLKTSKNQIEVDSASFRSSQSGIFAIGDINSYTGKRKLILCGFHEATLTAFAIAAKQNPDKPVHTQYTTTSSELLARLGVNN